jgi:hypothetical protein
MNKALLIIALVCPAFAQSATRQVVLTWEDLLNPAGTTYSIYRANGQCATATGFTRLASGATLKTHTDTANPGQYCYYVTATQNGAESDPSLPAEAKVKPAPPTKLTVTVN